jgi:hypothetical protein
MIVTFSRSLSRSAASPPYAAAGLGESTNDVSWDGQTMIYESGALLAETERFPDGPRSAVADIDLDRIRQDRLRQGTFDDNRRAVAPATSPMRTVAFTVDPRHPTSGCVARSTASPSCPTTRHDSTRTATRRSTSRCPRSSSGCARSGHRSP